MPAARRAQALALLALLLAPAFATLPAAATSAEPPIAVLDVRRSGDNVTVTATSTRFLITITASLLSGGTLIALPEQRMERWNSNEVKALAFQLLKDVESATFSLRWQEGGASSQSISIPIPPREGASGGTSPRIIVERVSQTGTVVDVSVANVGDAGAGRLLVAIEDAQQRKIGEPYYRALAPLAAGASATARFNVTGKLDTLVVAIEHAGKTDRVGVAVRSAASGADAGPADLNLTLSSELPFREVDLGRTVDFTVQVKNSGRRGLVQLEAQGLPSGYSARFFVGGSAVPSLFLDRNQTRQVTLSVTVPNAADQVDRTVDFAAVAKVNGTERGRLAMGLAVRGVGKLDLLGEDLARQVAPGGTGTFQVTVKNTGSAPLFNVELDSRRPYGWTLRFEPRRLDRLDPGEAKLVSVEVRAPDVIAPGRYGTDLGAKAGEVTSRFATLSVEIPEEERGGGWLWIVFAFAIGGILAFAVWKRRQQG